MDAAYLNETVSSTLTEALALLTRLQPEDPIEWLGKYLVSAADNLDRAQQHAEAASASAGRSAAESKRSDEEGKRGEGKSAEPDDIAALEAELAACTEVTPQVLDRVVALVQRATGATGVYVGEKVGSGSGLLGEGEEPPPFGPGSTCVKYLSATPDHAFMLKERLLEGQGVTWRSWVMPDAPADGEAEPSLPVLHETNLLHSQRVHYFRVPRPGALCVAPLQYDSLLHDSAIPDGAVLAPPPEPPVEEPPAEGSEDAEAEEEARAARRAAWVPPPPPSNPVTRSLALCADTMGQRRAFSAAQVATVSRAAAALRAALVRTEAAMYKAEFAAARAEALQQDDGSAAATREATSARLAAASAAAEAHLAATAPPEDAPPHPADVRTLALATRAIDAAKELLQERRDALAALAARRIGVRPEATRFVQSLLYFFGHKKEELGDPRAADPARFDWSAARALLAPDALLPRIEAFDAERPAATLTPPGSKPPPRSLVYLQPAAIRDALAAVTAEELDSVNPALGALYVWLTSTMDAQDAWAAQRARLVEEAAAAAAAKAQAEEDARLAAEAAAAEAAAEAAAAAAEAAAAAGGGEGEGAGEEEQPEE